MTNEEAIKTIMTHVEHWHRLLRDKICDETEGKETIEAFLMAIEALNQNQWIPCEERLPSAERKGKWLRYGEDGYPNEEDTVFWQCDQCLEQYTGRTTRIPNYCPNCGARMRGEEDVD